MPVADGGAVRYGLGHGDDSLHFHGGDKAYLAVKELRRHKPIEDYAGAHKVKVHLGVKDRCRRVAAMPEREGYALEFKAADKSGEKLGQGVHARGRRDRARDRQDMYGSVYARCLGR